MCFTPPQVRFSFCILNQLKLGGSDDWAFDVMLNGGNSGPLSYTFELRDNGRYGFIQPSNEIEPNCLEIDAAMDIMIKYVRDNK